MSKKFIILIGIVVAAALSGCDRVDNKRIPPAAVHIAFNTVGDWHRYGVAGAGQYKYFIKADREPADYPYTALSYTGFGGVLLISDIFGNPKAYDLSCPVEARSDVRIRMVEDEMIAECPVCHSTYDVVTNYGNPLGGKAAVEGYGLRVYNVLAGLNGEYMVISR